MDRRDFLKRSGGLVVSFTLGGLPLAAGAQAAGGTAGTAGTTGAGKSMAKNEVDAWLAIGTDGSVTVYSGKVDLGTGARTALAQMVAEELDVGLDRVGMVMGDTLLTPDQGQTAGSLTIQEGGGTLRRAAASARQALVARAAAQWSLPAAGLAVRDGVISSADGGHQIGYAELVAGKPLDIPLDPQVRLKPAAAHALVGKSVPRVDLPAKLTGRFTYVHDFRLPGMLHARVVRPAGPAATLRGVDEDSVRDIPGLVRVVRKENFLAVVCRSEWGAVKAARALKADWEMHPNFPAQDQLYAYWRALPESKVESVASTGDAGGALATARKRIKATYLFPPHTHGSIGPACAVADFRDGHCTIWSAAQSTHSLQGEISSMLGVPRPNVRLIYLDGAGCYGRNGHEDCSADAALVSQLAGAPVRVQWMRADEHGWDPKSPPAIVDLEAGLDARGKPAGWVSDFYLAQAHGTLDEFPLLAAVLSGVKRTGYITGNIQKNADVPYAFPAVSTRIHRMVDHAFRTAHLRSPGRMQNTFANEAFFDELAAAAGADPLQWRLAYLSDPRARAVLQDVARLSKWQARPSPAPRQRGDVARGRGLAFIHYDNERTYVALVAEVAVSRKDGRIRVTDIWCSHDCGQVVNPDGTRNQIEGGVVQSISRVLFEEVRFDRDRITSLDWAAYPILRFPDAPRITVNLLDHPDSPPWGAGEMAPATVPAAISNAVFDATGVRMRTVPFLPDAVLAGLKRGQAA
ncbi:molybdopterin cofactor-binding domain-containing protein [Cupriavidus sp. 30B13]|uniref:xanthine dehydrogenase family protein molybdopterin-binding subunit n=1 Tax=Cupriavidus sp. 30B13 TaxID=3384241 RepID=UPI003B8F7D23